MTRTLKITTVGLWIIILIIWTGNLFLGISAEVSDNVTEGIVEPIQESIHSEILQRQLISILFLIPMLIVFGLIVKAIRTKNNYLFYIGFCLTAIPLLGIGLMGIFQESEMPYKNLILLIICIPLLVGLIKSVSGIIKERKLTTTKPIRNAGFGSKLKDWNN
jgi:hypothetical protein